MKRSIIDDIIQPLITALGLDKTRISIALGIAIGYCIPIPPARVPGTVDLYFIAKIKQTVERYASEINERFLIEVDTLVTIAQVAYKSRYISVYPSSPAEAASVLHGNTLLFDAIHGYGFDSDALKLVIASAAASIERVERNLEDLKNIEKVTV